MTKFFVTSDTHFSHATIMADDKCPKRRQWCGPTIEDHDNALINAWNSKVGPDDVVIHAGDFAFGSFENVKRIRNALNGTIWMAAGNHDRGVTSLQAAFKPQDRIGKVLVLATNEAVVHVRHYPKGFHPDEIASSRWLWHGHLHDRDVPQESYKHVRWGVDVQGPCPHPWALDVHLLSVSTRSGVDYRSDQGDDL